MSVVDEAPTFVRVGPTRVRVRVIGQGTPLLLVMGIGGNLDMWDPLVPWLPDRQLIMFDFPGTGGSGKAWFPPTMMHNALFTATLLAQLGYGRVDVLGYSWGGLVAQQLALQHPLSVRRLVLASSTVGWGGLPPGPMVAARMLTPRRYYSSAYFAKVAASIYGGRFRTDPALVNDQVERRTARPPSIRGYASQLSAAMTYSSLPGLPLIAAPTLIIAGDDDPLVATFNPRLMARFLRHSTLHVVPGSGHLVLLDSPDIVGPVINTFLDAETS